jgi:hypothetical protein
MDHPLQRPFKLVDAVGLGDYVLGEVLSQRRLKLVDALGTDTSVFGGTFQLAFEFFDAGFCFLGPVDLMVENPSLAVVTHRHLPTLSSA